MMLCCEIVIPYSTTNNSTKFSIFAKFYAESNVTVNKTLKDARETFPIRFFPTDTFMRA